MNYCTNCGHKLSRDANFCNKCGFKVAGTTETNHMQVKTESENETPYSHLNNTAKRPNESLTAKFKNEVFMKPASVNNSTMDATTAQILHIISWVCFVLGLFTAFEIIFTIIGYFLARSAMKAGINANAARWANLILTAIYFIIFIIAFIVGLVAGLQGPSPYY